MGRRYDNRRLLQNNLRMYDSLLEPRGKSGKGIRIYETPELKHPGSYEISSLTLLPHRWTLGDKFFKLAHEHYGRPELWWVVAWFNQTPTESHVELGDLLYVPMPLEDVLDMLGV